MKNKSEKFFNIARNAAIVSGIFSLLVSIIILGNLYQLQVNDPINSEQLLKLIEKARLESGNEELAQLIRDLDLMIRKAHFTSLAFSRFGSFLLLGGVSLFLISLKIMHELRGKMPDPGKFTEPQNDRNSIILAQRAIVMVIGAIFVLALILPQFIENPLLIRVQEQKLEKLPRKFPTIEEIKENWSSFRGFNSLGIGYNKKPPTEWDGENGQNILWKTPIPRSGFSSPIAWNDKVFLTGGDKDSREVYCLDLSSGTILWTAKTQGFAGDKWPEVTEDTGFAAPTMTTDGETVAAIFATGELIALDFSGKTIWSKTLGVPDNHYGHSSSLLTAKEKLFVQFDHTGGAKLFIFDIADGKLLREESRKGETVWTSPAIIPVGSASGLILTGQPFLTAYDTDSGNELWRMKDVLSGELGPSPGFCDGKLFVANQYAKLACIDVQKQKIVWEYEDNLPEASSPVAHDNFLLLPSSYGKITCFNADSGERYWEHEFKKSFYSSPVVIAAASREGGESTSPGTVYLTDKTGITHIFALDKTFTGISDPKLGEPAVSTPAFVKDRILIRGEKHLYCIGSK